MAAAVRHLLLDLAGVLCRFDSSARIDRLAGTAGLDPEDVEQRLYGSGLVDSCDRGELGSAAMRDLLRNRLDLHDIDDRTLTALWASAFSPDDEVLALIDEVRPGITRSLLTNNDALLRDALPFVLPTVHARVALPLFSASTRATKPAPAAYTSALALLGCAPDAAFFVDDSPGNVEGARRIGIQAVHFTGVANLRQAFTEAKLLGR
jgi:HAD superfamily hydrolase (TIGR01509 family)